MEINTIEMQPPEEDVGRDTTNRFDMQYQAAAFAALEILKGEGIDCVYCDYHDDFVVRRRTGEHVSYHFFQVKTKAKTNYQWDLADIFAIKKTGQKYDQDSLQKVRKSFAGKLISHGIVFADNCSEVTLLTNVHFNDDVIKTVEELRGKVATCKAAKFLANHFSAIFSIEPAVDNNKTLEILGKLSLKPAVSHISPDREAFTSAARSAIFKYSEIDLDYYETTELATGLVDLVFRKSRTPLEGVDPKKIETLVGVGLNDLLEALSISRSAYDALLSGEDPKALKTASVLRRWLKKAGATDEMIEYSTQLKVEWDIWYRTARHTYSRLELTFLTQTIEDLYTDWVRKGAEVKRLHFFINEVQNDPTIKKFETITPELIHGAINSVIVRRNS